MCSTHGAAEQSACHVTEGVFSWADSSLKSSSVSQALARGSSCLQFSRASRINAGMGLSQFEVAVVASIAKHVTVVFGGAIRAPCGSFSPAGGPSSIQLCHAWSCCCGGLVATSSDEKMPAPPCERCLLSKSQDELNAEFGLPLFLSRPLFSCTSCFCALRSALRVADISSLSVRSASSEIPAWRPDLGLVHSLFLVLGLGRRAQAVCGLMPTSPCASLICSRCLCSVVSLLSNSS